MKYNNILSKLCDSFLVYIVRIYRFSIGFIITFILALSIVSDCWAHAGSAHEFLTVAAINKLTDPGIGNKFYGEYHSYELLDQIIKGSVEEDSIWYSTGLGLEHFYNPKTQTGVWVDHENALIKAKRLWEEAKQAYIDGNLDDAFHLLGRTVHLVEDMSTPSHIHNDIHILGDDFEEWEKKFFTNLQYQAEQENLYNSLFSGLQVLPPPMDTTTGKPLGVDWYIKELAGFTYGLSSFEGKLSIGEDPQPSSVLTVMFPPLKFYNHKPGQPNVPSIPAWVLDNIGSFYYAPDPSDCPPNAWIPCADDYTNTVDPNGIRRIEGNFYICSDKSAEAIPDSFPNGYSYRVPNQSIPNGGPITLVQIYIENVYPRCLEYITQLLQAFAKEIDSDNDDLPDAWEIKHWGDKFKVNDSDGDYDGDGFTNRMEFENRTNPRIPDTDGGGVSDGVEVVAGNIPIEMSDDYLLDTDGDDLPDTWEIQSWGSENMVNDPKGDWDKDFLMNRDEFIYRTKPTEKDSDGGGVYDGFEIIAKAKPFDRSDDKEIIDSDHDGLPDTWESQCSKTDLGISDTDGGGISDGDEAVAGTDPLNGTDDYILIDLDEDELPDVWEKQYWNDTTTVNDPEGDYDGDGLSNRDEYSSKTDPTVKDTDLGGVFDGIEVASGTNPIISSDDDTIVDSDSDGLKDSWERKYWGSIETVSDINGDWDNDSYTNVEEYKNKVDPTKKNTRIECIGDTQVDYNPSYLPVSNCHEVNLSSKLLVSTKGISKEELPLANQRVEFVIGYAQSGDKVVGILQTFTVFTDINGEASINAIPALEPGAYRLQACFDGDQTYGPSRTMPAEFIVTMNIYDYDPQSSPSALNGAGYPTGLPLGDSPMDQGTINHIPIHSFTNDRIKLESGTQVVYTFDGSIASTADNIANVYLLISAINAFPETDGSKIGTVTILFDSNNKQTVDLLIGYDVENWWSGNNYGRYVNQTRNGSTQSAWWSPKWYSSDIPPLTGQEYYYVDMLKIPVPAGESLKSVAIASENLIARDKYNVGIRLMGIQVSYKDWIISEGLQPGNLPPAYYPMITLEQKKTILSYAAGPIMESIFCSLVISSASTLMMPSIVAAGKLGVKLDSSILKLSNSYTVADLILKAKLLNLTADPPDYNYTTVAQPTIYSLAQFQAENPDDQVLVELVNDDMQRRLQIAGYLEAIYVSINRYSTAMAEGDNNSAELQIAAIKSYSESANMMMQQNTGQTQAIIQAWKEAGWQNPVVTESDITDLQTRLSSSGFSDEEKSVFTQLGIKLEELDEIKNLYLSADPKKAKGDFLTSLAQSAEDLKSLADTFLSIAENVSLQTTLTIPTIVTNYPLLSSDQVPVNDAIKIEFTQPMDASTINTWTFQLTDEQSNIIPCEVTYISETQTAIARPLANLTPLTKYTATLNTGAKDLSGNSLPWDWAWTFTTSGYRAYGGGWISHGELKASFNLNVALAEGAIKSDSSLKYFDQQTRTIINALSISSLDINGNRASISGSCTVNGIDGYSFSVIIYDSAPDMFMINVSDSQGNPVHSNSGSLSGGNMSVESVILSPTP